VRNSSGHTFSVIASDVEIVGNLTARVDLHVDGKVQGDVTCGNLVQGEGSIIAGKVIAEWRSCPAMSKVQSSPMIW
jgi:cytoskeletal protein CcmA (bactofilin family)